VKNELIPNGFDVLCVRELTGGVYFGQPKGRREENGEPVAFDTMIYKKSEIVRITDRGPYPKGRIIDVTVGCAERLGFYSRGVVPVKVEVLDKKS
jgi:hypothetical protein